MSKIVFRMRLPSPNLVVEFDEESGKVTIHACSTSYAARDQDLLLGGEGRVVELSDLVSRSFKPKGYGASNGQNQKSKS